MSRVQHVQDRQRRASLLRRATAPPPAIVVCELVDEHVFPSTGEISHLSRRATIPFDSKSVSPVHRAVDALRPHRPGLLHPQTAHNSSRFLGSPARAHSRFHSCPSSPVARSPTPPIRIDTNYTSVDYSHLEIAMEVAEEVARLCESPAPVPTDVPLVAAGLGLRTADCLRSWLDLRFDYTGQTYRLLDADFTAEALAHDILEHHPDNALALPRSGAIPIAFGSRITPSVTVPSDALDPYVSPGTGTLLPRESHARTRAREKELHIMLEDAGPPLPANKGPAKDPGTSEPRSSKKTGFVVGLLAMGALLGSPSPSPGSAALNARFAPASADPTPPNTAVLNLDLPRTPYSASGFGGWYAPASSAGVRTTFTPGAAFSAGSVFSPGNATFSPRAMLSSTGSTFAPARRGGGAGGSYFAMRSPLSGSGEGEELFWLSRSP